MGFLTPRALPSRRLPVIAGGLVVTFALPVFLAAGWDISGWVLGAVLWIASQVIGLMLSRRGIGDPSLSGSGVVAFGMLSRGILLMVALIVVASFEPDLALGAALVYAAGFTTELALSLAAYFSAEGKAQPPSTTADRGHGG